MRRHDVPDALQVHPAGHIGPAVLLLGLLWFGLYPWHGGRFVSGQTVPDDDAEVARVNERTIRWGDVQRELEDLRQRARWPDSWDATLRSALLAALVDRWVVYEYLVERNLAATPADVEQAMAELRRELEARGRTLEDYCRQVRRSEEQLRALLLWSLSWQRYLEKFLTDENAEKFFNQRRRQFDGTRLRVAHILWRVADGQEPQEYVKEAARVRQQILDGKLSFADAARKYSQAPSASEGGDLGWIERRRPMPESFSRAAFDLQVGQISPPVISAFGVHLIQCLEEQPGTRTWKDARAEIEAAMAVYLFRWTADRHRSRTTIIWNETLIARPTPEIARMLDAPLR